MFSSYIIENIKFVLSTDKITFQKIDWIYNTEFTQFLTLENEKKNNVHGILIFNISLTTNGSNIPFYINDQARNNYLVYRNENYITNSFIQPFVYFVPDNVLRFSANNIMSFGFNYVTVSKN